MYLANDSIVSINVSVYSPVYSGINGVCNVWL
jgi:hypothetical protein